MLVSLLSGSMGLAYQLLFIIGALTVTVLVEARGLFLTVASIPLLFGLVTPMTAWFVSQQGLAGAAPGVSVTEILSAVYPLAQYFPTLLMVTLVAALIAVVRIILLRRHEQQRQVTSERSRRAQREADSVNRSTANRAREQSTRARRSREAAPAQEQVTVDELVRRSRQRREEITRPRPRQSERREAPRRSLDDDLYS